MSRKLRKQQRKANVRENANSQAAEMSLLEIPEHFKPLMQKRGIQLLDWVRRESPTRYYFDIRSGKPYEVIYRSYDGAYTAKKLKQEKLKTLLKTSAINDITASLKNRDETGTLAQRWLKERPVSRAQKLADVLTALHKILSQQASPPVIHQLTEVARSLFRQDKKREDKEQFQEVSSHAVNDAYKLLLTLLIELKNNEMTKPAINLVLTIARNCLFDKEPAFNINDDELEAILLQCVNLSNDMFLEQLAYYWTDSEKSGLLQIFSDIDALKFSMSQDDDRHQVYSALKRARREHQTRLEVLIKKRLTRTGHQPEPIISGHNESVSAPLHFNPLHKPLKLVLIVLLLTPVVMLCSAFFGEQNIHSGTWIFGGITDVLLPFWMYIIFWSFGWTHWPSASKFCIFVVLLIVVPGHYFYFQDSVKQLANTYQSQNSTALEAVNKMTEKQMFSEYIKPTIKESSGILMLDNLRYRASVGTVAEEKAWIYGPYIDVHRQGFWVWFNWCFQILSLWLLCGVAFLIAQKHMNNNTNKV